MEVDVHMGQISVSPPVNVKLYAHQLAAYLFVLQILGILDGGGDADEHFHG